MEDKWYDCASAILLKGKKFLVEKRREDNDIDPGFVEIPSGHVDEGETAEEALRREMKEELGIDIKGFEKITTLQYIASNGEKELLHYFLIKDWEGKIKSFEAESVYWEDKIDNLSTDVDKTAMRKAFRML